MSTFEEEWRKRFERFAYQYQADHLVSGWSESGLRRRLSLFGELIEERGLPIPSRILDLGCGAGSYVRYLVNLGHCVVGIDYSLPSLSRALAADPERTGEYMAAQACQLGFRDESFDLVASVGVFQALGSPDQAMDEMVRVLRPKGLLLVEFLNAFEPIAVIKSVTERLRGQLSQVRTYSPFEISRCFEGRGLRIVRRAGIYLPPRRYPWLGRIFDRKGIVRLIEDIPGLSLATAHAFFLVGEKHG